MKKEKKKKSFLNLPLFPGGKEAFQKYIRENLRYPKEALDKRIEGKVYVEYQVNDNGDVIEAHVTKGIGHGCDEEAIRLIKTLKYEKVSNRGLRLTSSIKTTLNFKLSEVPQQLVFSYVPSVEKPNEPKPAEEQKPVYSYTITFNNPS